MSDKLPELSEDAFDGEKFSVKLEEKKCKHDVEMVAGELVCKKCGCAWGGPQIERLYEEFKKRR